MVLNYIWVAFFLLAILVALAKLIFTGDFGVFQSLVNASFDAAKSGFEISIGLTGMLTLWLGLMKVGERAGVIQIFSRLISPLFSRLFPEIPRNHPASGSMLMNVAANMLGLDNAATPLGLKAMKDLQECNPNPTVASNAQIMFLVLNTSGLTLIPISIIVYRTQLGAVNPADIFLPILLATFFSTLAALISVSIFQKIKLWHPVILAYLGGVSTLVLLIIFGMAQMDKEQMANVSSFVSSLILMSLIGGFIGLGFFRKINVFESFIEGAKDGFQTAITIIPYLIAILVSVGVFRASGGMDYLVSGLGYVISQFGWNTDFIPALPVALMKPLSGSGARGLMVDAMTQYGADSFVGRLSCVFQGSTDTTFYVLALYFGSVGIKNSRYALTCGLIADFVGIVASIVIAYLFFG